MSLEGAAKKREDADMSSGDALKRFSEAALKMAAMLSRGEEVSDRGYQRELLQDVLLYLGKELSKAEVPVLQGPKRVLVLLPANVPVIPFQMAPLIEAYRLDVVFKVPSSERKFYEILGALTGFKFAELSHKEAMAAAGEFDFTVGFGGESLGKALKSLKLPHRFFGPRFSIGILEEGELFPLLIDALSFDGEACLAPVLIFTKGVDWREVEEGLKRASCLRPPQRSFNRYPFEYYREFLLYYAEEVSFLPSESAFLVRDFPRIIPQRSVFIVQGGTEEEILDFLKERAMEVQAIISSRPFPLLMEKTSASLRLLPSRSQFPPLGWFFQKNLTLENFFSL